MYRKILTWPDPKAVEALVEFVHVRITEQLVGQQVSFFRDNRGRVKIYIDNVIVKSKLNKDDNPDFFKWVEDNVLIKDTYPFVMYHGIWLTKDDKITYSDDAYNKFYLEDLEHVKEGTFHSVLNEVGTEFIEQTEGAFFAPILYAGKSPASFPEYIFKSKLGEEVPFGIVIRDLISKKVVKILNANL